MDIEQSLLTEHSKSLTLKIASWIGGDTRRMKRFMDVFTKGDPLVMQRGAWVIGKLADTHPEVCVPFLKELIALLAGREDASCRVHDAVPRNITRLLQSVPIPRSLEGRVLTVCFDLLESASEPVAVKVYAMSVIERFCAKEPDLERELRLVIEAQLALEPSAAFRARARRVLKASPAAASVQ